MSYNNHCPYCQASISGPFHTNDRDSVYQAEIDELKQENGELQGQLYRLNHALTVAINAIRNPFTIEDPNHVADNLAEYLTETRTNNEN